MNTLHEIPDMVATDAVEKYQRTEAVASTRFGIDVGPSYCDDCNDWPASMTPRGKRCHLCWTRDIAAENPVPLPDGKRCLEDLASIGVPGAAEKLAAGLPEHPR